VLSRAAANQRSATPGSPGALRPRAPPAGLAGGDDGARLRSHSLTRRPAGPDRLSATFVADARRGPRRRARPYRARARRSSPRGPARARRTEGPPLRRPRRVDPHRSLDLSLKTAHGRDPPHHAAPRPPADEPPGPAADPAAVEPEQRPPRRRRRPRPPREHRPRRHAERNRAGAVLGAGTLRHSCTIVADAGVERVG
jgi:hypothetical protein